MCIQPSCPWQWPKVDAWELVQERSKHLVVFTQKTLPASKNLHLSGFLLAVLAGFLFRQLLQLPTEPPYRISTHSPGAYGRWRLATHCVQSHRGLLWGCAYCLHLTPTLLVSENIVGTSSSPWQSWSSDPFSYLLCITFLSGWRIWPV